MHDRKNWLWSVHRMLCYCSYIYLHFTLFCILFVNIYKIYLYVAHAWLMNWSYYRTPLHIEFQWQLQTVIFWVVMLCQLVGEHQHLEGTSCYNLHGQRHFGISSKSVTIDKTISCYKPVDHNLNTYCHENL